MEQERKGEKSSHDGKKNSQGQREMTSLPRGCERSPEGSQRKEGLWRMKMEAEARVGLTSGRGLVEIAWR